MLEALGCPGTQSPHLHPNLRGTFALPPAEARGMCGCPLGAGPCVVRPHLLWGTRPVRPRSRHPLVGLAPTGLEAAAMLQLSWASAMVLSTPTPGRPR